jgi:glycosyltransferase involved in cell wall biosynthesis
LRIIHCFRSPVGGIFRHVRDLAEKHTKAGHKVGILCDSTTGGSLEDSYFDNIRPYLELGLIRIPIRRSIGLNDIRALSDTFQHVKSLQPDVLHGHGAKGGALARVIGSALRVHQYRVARLYSPHGGSLHFQKNSPKGFGVFQLERLLELCTDHLVFVSQQECQTYERKIGILHRPHDVVYNGIGDHEFGYVEPAADAVDFLYIGMMRDMKGPDVFIEAFAKAERRLGRPLSAVMVGDGPDTEKYKDMILTLGLGKRIVMLPPMPPRTAFTFSTRVVVPSRAEAMPYIVIEALAAGRTVIASNVGGIPEVLGATSPALAIPGDADDLSRIMADSISIPYWSDSLVPDSETIRLNFSASNMAARILDIYQLHVAENRSSVSVS